jgi:hypothetical protein
VFLQRLDPATTNGLHFNDRMCCVARRRMQDARRSAANRRGKAICLVIFAGLLFIIIFSRPHGTNTNRKENTAQEVNS